MIIPPLRGGHVPTYMLDDYKGYLQTDGYAAYEKFGKKKDITHLACWAHARREFEKGRQNDSERAKKALRMYRIFTRLSEKPKKKSYHLI